MPRPFFKRNPPEESFQIKARANSTSLIFQEMRKSWKNFSVALDVKFLMRKARFVVATQRPNRRYGFKRVVFLIISYFFIKVKSRIYFSAISRSKKCPP